MQQLREIAHGCCKGRLGIGEGVRTPVDDGGILSCGSSATLVLFDTRGVHPPKIWSRITLPILQVMSRQRARAPFLRKSQLLTYCPPILQNSTERCQSCLEPRDKKFLRHSASWTAGDIFY